MKLIINYVRNLPSSISIRESPTKKFNYNLAQIWNQFNTEKLLSAEHYSSIFDLLKKRFHQNDIQQKTLIEAAFTIVSPSFLQAHKTLN
jgi:hypothetical protein